MLLKKNEQKAYKDFWDFIQVVKFGIKNVITGNPKMLSFIGCFFCLILDYHVTNESSIPNGIPIVTLKESYFHLLSIV